MSEGHAATIVNMSDIGTLYGLGVSSLMDADRQGAAGMTLLGAGAGLLSGAIYANRRDHTYGDASVMRTAGWVGGYLGLSIAGISGLDEWDDKTATSAMIAGSAAGLVVGDGLVRRTDFNFGQGVIVDLSTAGGWLFGLGIALVASDGDWLDESTYWVATGLGTAGGYALGYLAGSRSARRAAADRTGWRWDVLPTPPARGQRLPGVTVAVSVPLH